MSKKSLARTNQCANCPWKKASDPHKIDGYRPAKHEKLADTIAEPFDGNLPATVKVMACHHSTDGNEEMCIGWLYNQLHDGNNVPLRIMMLGYDNVSQIKIHGDQHAKFTDTIPNKCSM